MAVIGGGGGGGVERQAAMGLVIGSSQHGIVGRAGLR